MISEASRRHGGNTCGPNYLRAQGEALTCQKCKSSWTFLIPHILVSGVISFALFFLGFFFNSFMPWVLDFCLFFSFLACWKCKMSWGPLIPCFVLRNSFLLLFFNVINSLRRELKIVFLSFSHSSVCSSIIPHLREIRRVVKAFHYFYFIFMNSFAVSSLFSTLKKCGTSGKLLIFYIPFIITILASFFNLFKISSYFFNVLHFLLLLFMIFFLTQK